MELMIRYICSPPPTPPPPAPSPPPMFVQSNDLDSLNAKADLEFFTFYENDYRDNTVNDDPYFGVNLSSKFYDIDTLSSLCVKEKSAIYLSINIQIF
jgi:hypothetical protein